jgi:lysyl-tRNA synthetase class 2
MTTVVSSQDLRHQRLLRRALLLKNSRDFFEKRGVVEIDTPLLTSAPSIDAHIDLIEADKRFLITSPEYAMKRLLAEGFTDCYQLSHVFRAGEISHKHQPEFTLCEWYRLGFSYEEMMEETIDFVSLFVGNLPRSSISYREAFRTYAGLDPYEATLADLIGALKKAGVDPYGGDDRDLLLNQLLAILVEPNLGQGEIQALTYFPSSQAALAKLTVQDGHPVAERFEIYYQGLELGNGYHELADAKEQRARFHEGNLLRKEMGKKILLIDEFFLSALPKLPDCSGVAVGFDRLVMLHLEAANIRDVIPFSWENI